MGSLDHLLERNRRWSERIRERDPGFFPALSRQQRPKYLWIGCADSRVPANDIVDLRPGEVFVHRNVANVVVHSDMNCMSVLQYAVEILRVEQIIVCGHYGCGGVRTALGHQGLGLIDNWLRHIKDIYRRHADELADIDDDLARLDRLCELNVINQVHNVCHSTIVQNAWLRGQPLAVNGWIYGLENGLVNDLDVRISGFEDIDSVYHVTPVG